MARVVKSAMGQLVDFDELIIKSKLPSSPKQKGSVQKKKEVKNQDRTIGFIPSAPKEELPTEVKMVKKTKEDKVVEEILSATTSDKKQ